MTVLVEGKHRPGNNHAQDNRHGNHRNRRDSRTRRTDNVRTNVENTGAKRRVIDLTTNATGNGLVDTLCRENLVDELGEVNASQNTRRGEQERQTQRHVVQCVLEHTCGITRDQGAKQTRGHAPHRNQQWGTQQGKQSEDCNHTSGKPQGRDGGNLSGLICRAGVRNGVAGERVTNHVSAGGTGRRGSRGGVDCLVVQDVVAKP